jgi:acyl carrier protein
MDAYETIERFIVDNIVMEGDSTRIAADTNLLQAGVLDSLSTLKLISFVEETFGVSFESADIDAGGFHTLSTITRLISTKRALTEPQ